MGSRLSAIRARIKGKIRNNLDDIIETESYRMEDAEIVIVSYGISVRTGLAAVDHEPDGDQPGCAQGARSAAR